METNEQINENDEITEKKSTIDESKFNTLEKIRAFVQMYCKKTVTKKDPIGFSYFQQLLAQHPTWKDKVDSVHRFRVTRSKLNNSCILQIECDWSDKFFTVSWKKCHMKRKRTKRIQVQTPPSSPIANAMISATDLQLFKSSKPSKPSDPSHITQVNEKNPTEKRPSAKEIADKLTCAMRYAVRRQIATWKRQNSINRFCKQCKSTSSLQCDHVDPFVTIKTNFIRDCNESIPDSFDYSFKTCQSRFKRKDKSFKLRWQHYHLKHASYQWLCKTCNLKKGKHVI
jgi:hypothetical protein